MLTAIKAKGTLILVGLLIVALGAGAWIWKGMQDRLQEQERVIAAQDIKIAEADTIIEGYKEDIERQKKITASVNRRFANSREEVQELRDRFNKIGSSSRVTRDLGKLAIGKPELIERVINRGTEKVMRCVEIVSGAELTEAEINATKRSEINEFCEDLANPNYTEY